MSASTSVPRISIPNPHIRKPSLSSQLHIEFNGSNSARHEEPVPAIPLRHLQRKTSTASIEGAQPVRPVSLVDGLPPPPPPLKRDASGRYIVPDEPKTKHRSSPPMTSHDSGYSSMTPAPKSPVVPFRSMFPAYDPTVPLAKQNYQPTRPLQARLRDTQTSSIVGMTPIDRALGPKSAPQSIYDASPGPSSPRISKPKDLEQLWQATHGMEPSANITSYTLELSRTEEATFALGASPAHPFYSMVTYDTNELALSKFNPRKPTVKVEVSLNSIEHSSRRLPPNDGLVTFIFPKLAAMLAINQSTALAAQHDLAPTHRDEMQAAAVRRAADQEACKLVWNAEHQHYELEHPAVGRKAVADAANFTLSPDLNSARTPALKQALDIFVSSSIGHSLPTITVAHPRPADLESTSTPTIPGIRMSTIPQRDTDPFLAILDFNTRTLTLNTNQILECIPSLFAIDSLVSAIMAIAVADETTNPIMAAMEVWQPSLTPPSAFSSRVLGRANSTFGGSVAGQSTTGSVFYATIAEREEAEAEARKLAETHERDIKNKRRRQIAAQKSHKLWFGKSKPSTSTSGRSGSGSGSVHSKIPKEKPAKKVVTAEFDLEKLSHYQGGDREGQKLPGPARLVLKVLVGGLKAVVYLMTAIVQFFVWIVVHLTRGVTSEKF